MPSEKKSSTKKITQQTISITPELRERVEKFVLENHEKNPNDKRFKSISSYYSFILEKTMDCFREGKNLDDFELFVDGETRNFFDKISFNAVIPYYEDAIKTNKYTDPAFEKTPFFFLAIRRLYLSMMDPNDISSIRNAFNRIRNYFFSNNLTLEFRLDLITGQSGSDIKGIFEFAGIYKNLSFESCKYNAAIFGLLGVKITNVVYSDKDIYYRFDLETTDLFFRKDLVKNERIKLMNHNVAYLINYKKILEDKDYYLWLKMAEDRNLILSFNTEQAKQEWANLIETEIKNLVEQEDYLLYILKFFEKLHWVEIENEKDLIFQIRLSKNKHQYEWQFLFDTLSKHSKISELDRKYYLEKHPL
ncbi:MAG: hypothetical protein ACW97V_05795 [Promethearchaeota archaeon]|jgi:hypothetical protein